MELKPLYFLIVTIGVLFIVHDACAISSVVERYRKSLIEATTIDLSKKYDSKFLDRLGHTPTDLFLLHMAALPTKDGLTLGKTKLKQDQSNKHNRVVRSHDHHRRKLHSHRSRSKDLRRRTNANDSPKHRIPKKIIIGGSMIKFADRTHVRRIEEHIRDAGIRKAGRDHFKRKQLRQLRRLKHKPIRSQGALKKRRL